MKKITLFFTLLLASLPFEHTWSQDSNKNEILSKSTILKIGYTNGHLNPGMGSGITFHIQGAIQFPASSMQRLKGNRITTVRLAIATELSQQENTIFITNKLTGKPFYTQKVNELNTGWNEIVLDTPYEITGDEIFIGFHYVSSGDVISFDGGEDNNYGNWLAHAQSESELSWTHQPGGCNNLQAIVEGDKLPQDDAALTKIGLKKYAHPGGELSANLFVRNMAAAEIQNLEVKYTVEEQEPVTCIVENLSIKSNDIAQVPLKGIVIEKAGIYNIEIQVTKVNGNSDENTTDNTMMFENMICKQEYTNRKVLLEQFSTMECVNCPLAHDVLERALEGRDDVIKIVHHAGYGTDPLTIKENMDYLFFFKNEAGIGNTYAPAMMLDRINLSRYGATGSDGNNSPGPACSIQGYNAPKLIEQSVSAPALVSLEIQKDYNKDSRILTVSASGKIPSGDVAKLKGNNICLNIVLTEDSILGTQKGSEQPEHYFHSQVLRKVITSTWGDPIKFSGDSFQSDNYNFTIPVEWVDKQMHVVAFIANQNRNSSNDCAVYNSEKVSLTNAIDTNIETPIRETTTLNVHVDSQTRRLYVNGEYIAASIYNASGILIKEINHAEAEIDICSMDKGVYFIKLKQQAGLTTTKFIITK